MTAGSATAGDVPAGFKRLTLGGPYFVRLGPSYYRLPEQGSIEVGIRVTEEHSNVQGNAHGGMVSTLADGALGIALVLARQKRGGQVTVSLSSEFLSAARIGEWLKAHARVTRLGSRLAFLECQLRVEQRLVMRCQAIFSISDRHVRDDLPVDFPS